MIRLGQAQTPKLQPRRRVSRKRHPGRAPQPVPMPSPEPHRTACLTRAASQALALNLTWRGGIYKTEPLSSVHFPNLAQDRSQEAGTQSPASSPLSPRICASNGQADESWGSGCPGHLDVGHSYLNHYAKCKLESGVFLRK